MAGSPWTNQVVNLIVLTEQATGFSGLFGYSPTTGTNNLIFALDAAAGTDPYGNAYSGPGLALSQQGATGVKNNVQLRADKSALLIYGG